ncbi:MAG: DEAD/DEAH box helicase family protein, partial [Proteobacteria bacterium]|nr:DEAD/DEAH box helicase family protein [Pseudomonadota bacterium]
NKSRRGADEKIRWKYFQYLALLFAEIYLDRYFRDAEGMLGALNAHVSAFNEGKLAADCIDDFAPADLRRIAFFQATGSGKTLLMHINIMQYKHYLKLAGRENELNRIILLTPNDGLSRQHLAEFDKSSMSAKPFEKNSSGGFLGNQFIEVIDIHKLGDKMGDKTVDVAAFEGNNLVLVDEGHRGSSGEEWMKRRNHLSKDGFSFEYSATFEQAISASRDKVLEQQYAKAILFNYSYKYFYADGFGKDYKILNLDDSTDDDRSKRRRYLIACMLSFYQQMRLFQTDPNMAKKYNLEKPLLVLVGARVTKGFNSKEASDVIEFLRFLAGFVKSKKETIDEIAAILAGKHDLMAGDKNVFYG